MIGKRTRIVQGDPLFHKKRDLRPWQSYPRPVIVVKFPPSFFSPCKLFPPIPLHLPVNTLSIWHSYHVSIDYPSYPFIQFYLPPVHWVIRLVMMPWSGGSCFGIFCENMLMIKYSELQERCFIKSENRSQI